ncbi:MAG: Uncharacterised protein [Pseudidiomarina mangrovi]|nr:MAG: Uncharacterised protein [Pseudidiomarina mangrovi]
MNYNHTELQHQLAARYVVGSMRGAARRRFQRLLMDYPKLRSEVAFWEQHLHELTDILPPLPPHERVWRGIQQRLGWLAPAQQKRWTWPWLTAAVASVLLVANLAIMTLVTPPDTAIIDRVAVIQNQQARTLWLIEQRQQQLRVAAVGAIEPLINEDYQLWMLPTDGTDPVSLGLLPQQGEVLLALVAAVDLNDVAALAVSREPLGGSPLSVPTGPVLYTTDLIIL